MNTKGFTLVELLLSIVILSLILLIAVPSISNISDAVRKSQRKNTIKNIEIAASKYAFDTGETIIFVDKLVTEGYIESDNDGNIKDPENNERLNCYIIEMEKVSDYYESKFIDGKNYDENGVCNLEKLKQQSSDILIEPQPKGEYDENDKSTWLTGNIMLNAYGLGIDIDCETNKCVWTSTSGANVVGKDAIEVNKVTSTLNTTYTFQYTIYNDVSKEVNRYKQSYNLRIDNESPIIYENELNVTNKFIYTENKIVTISASDGKGSGIAGYYLAPNNSQTCYNNSISFQTSNKFTVTSNGNYLICVKDKAGNITSYSDLTIKYIN